MSQLTCKIHWIHSTNDESFDSILWNQWEKRQKENLSRSVHPVRLKSSVLARMSFEKLKRLHGTAFNPSYSHTEELGLCSVTLEQSLYSGIDIERSDRVIRKDALKMFINDDDSDLTPLQLWCLKEAAFKALNNSLKSQGPKLIKPIIIHENQKFSFGKFQGDWKLTETFLRDHHYLVALTSLYC